MLNQFLTQSNVSKVVRKIIQNEKQVILVTNAENRLEPSKTWVNHLYGLFIRTLLIFIKSEIPEFFWFVVFSQFLSNICFCSRNNKQYIDEFVILW